MVIRNSKIVSTALSAALVASMLATGGTVAAQGKSGEVSIQSATQQYKAVTVIIDGKVQQFPQSAVVKDGSTLVPLRGIFEALGAKVLWEEASHSVTATKGDTVIKLTVDQRTAYINDRAIELSAQAQTLNGSTMVPLRFVSEALGADVKWDGDTYTATITNTVGSGQFINGIKVQYGKHHYGSKSQAEYDKVMAKLKQEVDSRLPDVKVGGDRYSEYYERYLNGDRASNYERNTMDSIGLTTAEKNLKTLMNLGLGKDKVMELMKLSVVGVDLIGTARPVDDGSPNSLGDLLLRGVRDCDPEAELYSAIFDMYGYNTAIIAGDNHASTYVQVDGVWVSPKNGTFAPSDISDLLSQSGFYIYSQPTFGGSLKGGSDQVDQGGSQVVNGIKVQYGKHHYGSKNQAEYDKVMTKLKQELDSRLGSVKVGDKYSEYYERYLIGDRAENYERNTLESRGLTAAEKDLKPLVNLSLGKDKIMDLMKLSIVGVDLIGTSKVVDDGSPNSLADLLLRGVSDCDPEAYLYSAIFDMQGYNTAIIAGDNHAQAYVQINGEWVSPMNGTFIKSDATYYLSQSGFYILSQPTLGGTL